MHAVTSIDIISVNELAFDVILFFTFTFTITLTAFMAFLSLEMLKYCFMDKSSSIKILSTP